MHSLTGYLALAISCCFVSALGAYFLVRELRQPQQLFGKVFCSILTIGFYAISSGALQLVNQELRFGSRIPNPALVAAALPILAAIVAVIRNVADTKASKRRRASERPENEAWLESPAGRRWLEEASPEAIRRVRGK